MSHGRYLVFVLVVATISGLLHTYLWWRLVHSPGWPAPWSRVGGWFFALMAVGVPASFLAWQLLPRQVALPFIWVGYVWMGLMFLLLVFAVLGEPVRVASGLVAWFSPAHLSAERRLFIQRLLSAVAGSGALAMGLYGVASVLSPVAVRRVSVKLTRANGGLRGLKIAQITDVHIGPTIGRAFLEDVVRRVNALEPDLVAITGDLVDGSVAELGDAVGVLRDLRAPHGVYFVTGNHEYYSGADDWLTFLRSLGVRVLRNERVSLERAGEWLDVLGIDDWTAGQFGGDHGPDLPKAMAGRDASRPALLLAHQPKAFPEAARLGIDLQLSGHTHGGQIKPFHVLTKLDTPFVHGLYREGESHLYVSGGTGYWGPPMRVGVPAEITLIEVA